MPLDKYRRANLDSWNQRVEIHADSKFYSLEKYVEDPDHLSVTVDFDRTELGDVRDKSLLHLQCHIGTDTLSWARLGATVTGVDFSELSIEQARTLSKDSGTPGEFVVAELYDTPNVIQKQFDIVYTGIGALVWLPDISGWAKVVSAMLKPGGTFYVRDGHPMTGAIESSGENGRLVVAHPYFETEAMKYEEDFTYTDGPQLPETMVNYEWNHGLGEIVTALVEAGLRIEFLHEHQFAEFQAFPACVGDGKGRWSFPEHPERMPLMFSIRAVKQ